MPRQASLSLDLLKTLVTLVDHDGDAGETAKKLQINQPSMSKRLRYLQLKSPVLKSGPWLEREGKTWRLTAAGRQALPGVRDLVNRYEQLIQFTTAESVDLRVACGRHAVVGFVKVALRKFREKFPDSRVRLSTLRADDRIAGVANGALDLATVDHDIDLIEQVARRKLHVEQIAVHRLGLVCHRKAKWADKLSRYKKTDIPIDAFRQFPLILPEPDAAIRRALEPIFRHQGVAGKMDVRLEIGGWGTILEYVRDRQGVGLVSESAVRDPKDLVVRYFDGQTIPSSKTKIICRFRFNSSEPELTEHAAAFYEQLKEAAGSKWVR